MFNNTTIHQSQPFSWQLRQQAGHNRVQQLEAQEKEAERCKQSPDLLPQLYCTYSCFKTEGVCLNLCVQLDPPDASSPAYKQQARLRGVAVLPRVTTSAICTTLHLCSASPQKCFALLFARPLDKYIIHQHNHPIIIQLRRSRCQLVLCVNDPFQKNRLRGVLWVPSLTA